jgi:hypothetical protein
LQRHLIEDDLKEEKKKGYWLQCDCGYDGAEYAEVTGCNSAGAYLWDKVRLKWDQSLLQMGCPKCNQSSLRITYAFPRRDHEVVQAIHVVGLSLGDDYTPMMWESRCISRPNLQWFHFNYLGGRNPYGLSRPAVLSYDELGQLFALYEDRTGKRLRTHQGVPHC